MEYILVYLVGLMLANLLENQPTIQKHQSKNSRSHHHTVIMIVIADVVMVLVCFSNRSDIIPRGCSC